jgi:hypothetical protein
MNLPFSRMNFNCFFLLIFWICICMISDVGFLIVGAQKAGTMAAVKNLNKHPDLFVLKEIHFFDLGWHSSKCFTFLCIHACILKYIHTAGSPEKYRSTFREELEKQQPQKLSAYVSMMIMYVCMYVCTLSVDFE